MVGVSASVNLPLHHKVHKFSSGTGSPEWSQKRAIKGLFCVVCVVDARDYSFSLFCKYFLQRNFLSTGEYL